MSAHRRPALREAARRRLAAVRPRRRTRSGTHRLLPVALGLGLLAIAAVAGPGVVGGGWNGEDGQNRERITFAALPDVPDQGLIYDGLRLASADSLCAGSYQLDELTCTHGPDPAPAGLRVRRSVPPVTEKAPEPAGPRREAGRVPADAEIVRDQGGSALTPTAPALIPDAAPGDADFVMGSHDVACAGDGRTGKRVQVLYLHEFGTPSRYPDYLGSMRVWSAGVDAIFDASAAETGGSRHVRFVTTPQCRVDVAEVQVPEGALASFTASIDALQTLGYNRTDRKYLIFADANVYCGIGTYIADRRPGLGNRNNGGPSYGRVDSGCWSSTMAAREVTYTLGAVLQDSPNASGAGGCTDDYDLLCGRDRSGKPVRTVCPKKHENRLDCGHDDYFHTSPKPDSYLARNWNVAQSEFLLRTDGGDDLPEGAVPAQSPATTVAPTGTPSSPAATTAPPADPKPGGAPATPGEQGNGPPDDRGKPTPSAPASTPPGAEPSAETPPAPPTAGASGSAPPADPVAQQVQAVLEIRDPTSTAVRLTWSAAARDARYEVAVDGVPVATTAATRAQLIGLKPDTSYQVSVRSEKHGYLARSTARTVPAARPAQNTWFVLTNSLTGGAADLYAARTASGTPITLGGTDGDAQQQWKFVPASGGTFALQSRATGKCVVPLDGNLVAGTPLVQGDCTADAGRWSLQASDYGFTLRTTVGDLAVGVGDQRFGAHRLLVLQQGNGSRHQSWTAVPG
ncbi:ricin-type beta-trefoil lectin protein [Krasilnikovia cinnamomea]|uniref:Ricin-type beta-trefoil lectin protein n=1 Tax=Krasilnikovia cinnamomea TaxID=349313 RepID=A0A4Q7ZFC9_9ACTN|nr:RICIN domain-containing protein [Krasilnikovia cinnamomea]RZU49024.1 ricin-type beta-trefoil lectin protein [Krasilnikovia cinnamomea]